MSTLHQLREGLNEAWDSLVDGWQRLYRHAAGAITRFYPGREKGGTESPEERREIAERSTGWGVLAAEVFDDDDNIVVRLEAPGMEKTDIDLQVRDGYLVISGEKQIQRERTQGRYHVTECAYGRFERAIPLPEEVASDKASASYRNGVLRVELPKTKSGRRHGIKVEVR
ncbi:MAG: Hsp20/alpha crystallin family protein [Gammaproteobacteria bacterium]|jgi:HSP20 family protein|nr:Hsp20/alpha crystallin family protein [Gammaproteobacteria bacterium]